MIDNRPKKKEKIDFLLENSHYKKLHLYLYIASILVFVLIYFLFINMFSTNYKLVMSAIVSVFIGTFLVFNREKIIKNISERMHEKNIRKRREENKRGLESTIKRIRPSHKSNRHIKLNIGGKTYIKDKFSNFKERMTKKKDDQSEYIEIK